MTRLLGACCAALTLAAILPATAAALAVTVTGDDGQPLPFNGEPGIRNMNPSVGIALSGGEKLNYTASFIGPDGANASSAVGCRLSGTNRPIDYRGNGRYTIKVQRFAEKDYTCKTQEGPDLVYTFTINASASLAQLPARVLIRQPNSFVTQPVTLPVGLNPGTIIYELRYALNGVVGPDGAISGPSTEAFVDRNLGNTTLRLQTPGRYVAVVRGRGPSVPGGPFSTAWSAPVVIDAIAPFDLENVRVPDARGPRYRISGKLREKTATGRVSLAYARGTKGGRYRSLGSVRLTSAASFTKRITIRRSGTYRMRFTYRGGPTVAPGVVVQQFRISRRIAF